MARENARTIREIMPRVSFEYINDLYLYAKDRAHRHAVAQPTQRNDGRRDAPRAAHRRLSVRHDGARRYVELPAPRRVPRTRRHDDAASSTCARSTCSTPTERLEPYSQVQWRSVLRSLHALQTYQLAVQEPIQQPLVLAVPVQEPGPAALARATAPSRIRSSLRSLAAQSEAARRDQPRHSISRRRSRCRTLKDAELHAFIDDCQLRARATRPRNRPHVFPRAPARARRNRRSRNRSWPRLSRGLSSNACEAKGRRHALRDRISDSRDGRDRRGTWCCFAIARNTPAPASASQAKDDTGTLSTGTFVAHSDHRCDVHRRAGLRATQRRVRNDGYAGIRSRTNAPMRLTASAASGNAACACHTCGAPSSISSRTGTPAARALSATRVESSSRISRVPT